MANNYPERFTMRMQTDLLETYKRAADGIGISYVELMRQFLEAAAPQLPQVKAVLDRVVRGEFVEAMQQVLDEGQDEMDQARAELPAFVHAQAEGLLSLNTDDPLVKAYIASRCDHRYELSDNGLEVACSKCKVVFRRS